MTGTHTMLDLPVCDAHTDLLMELAARSELDDPFGELWLAQLQRGNVRLQMCPIYAGQCESPAHALQQVVRQAAAFHRAVRQHPDDVMVITTAADLAQAEASGRIGLLLALEGAECVADDLDVLDLLWGLGLRMIGPFWALSNSFGDGNAGSTHGGLTALGHELVARASAQGFILDLAHCSDASFADVLSATSGEAPVVVTHTGCRALQDNARNMTDAQLREIATRGGVVGIFALPPFIDPIAPTRAALAAHIEHALGVTGRGHVGLGGDFVQQLARAGLMQIPAHMVPRGLTVETPIEGLAGPGNYGALLRTLQDRGLEQADLMSVAFGAFHDFISAHLPSAHT